MRKTVTPLALALCGALTAPALADPTDALATEATALADAAHIPAEPLLKKIREGRAKGVPSARIRPAVLQLRDRLVQGSALCGGSDDVLCITAAADAVASGAQPAALQQMLDGIAGADQRSRAFVAVATLGGHGMSGADAIGEVSRALAEQRLDDLLPSPALARPGADGSAAPPAAGRGGELPVQDAARDRDQTGAGNAWGRDKVKPEKPGKPDELTKTKKPKKPGRPDKVRGNNGNGNGNGNGNNRD